MNQKTLLAFLLSLVLVVFLSGCVDELPKDCADSDGGKDYYIKGMVSYAGESIEDSCKENTLTEYYCVEGLPNFEVFGCANYCFDGACAQEPTACAQDAMVCPDGSTVSRIPPDCEFAECPETEFCDSSGSCPAGSECYLFPGQENPECFSGNPCTKCDSGKCSTIESNPMQIECIDSNCTDSDGGKNYLEFGTVIYLGETYADYCVEDGNLQENFCENDEPSFEKIKCSDGRVCIEGVCAHLSKEDFCGISTKTKCSSGNECKVGGCSSQVCESVNESTATTCEYKDCYDASKYNLSCQCIEEKCMWAEPGPSCATYTRYGEAAEHCAVCGNSVCEPYENCVASDCSYTSSGEKSCTDDCGKLYCPEDCEKQSGPCTDSDGGKNYYKRGSTYWTGPDGVTLTDLTRTDNCAGPKTLKEYDCESIETLYECSYSCYFGRCYDMPFGECFDSDGGKYYHVKGYVEIGGERFEDFCTPEDKRLFERECGVSPSDGSWTVKTGQVICPLGCADGACFPAKESQEMESMTSCYDSNPHNIISMGGYLEFGGLEGRIYDHCIEGDPAHAYKHTCYIGEDGYWVSGKSYRECYFGTSCILGACRPPDQMETCAENETRECGTDIGPCEKGTQRCMNSFWSACEGGIAAKNEVCDNSIDDDCDGTLDEEECFLECKDSDGGLGYYTKGYATGTSYTGAHHKDVEDYCGPVTNQLSEWRCRDDGVLITTEYLCPAGCFEGRCLNETYPELYTCKDSDGLGFETAGKTCYVSESEEIDCFYDKCYSMQYVNEYTCLVNNFLRMGTYVCDTKCEEGRCLPVSWLDPTKHYCGSDGVTAYIELTNKANETKTLGPCEKDENSGFDYFICGDAKVSRKQGYGANTFNPNFDIPEVAPQNMAVFTDSGCGIYSPYCQYTFWTKLSTGEWSLHEIEIVSCT